MTSASDTREAIREMLALTPEDWAKAQTIDDPEVLRDLLLGARAFGTQIDRSTLAQVDELLADADWGAVLKAALPLLLSAL